MSDEADYHDLMNEPRQHLDEVQLQWLKPLSWWQRVLRGVLYWTSRLVMRMFYQTRAVGLEHLPGGQFILCPNHASSLDAAAILSVLPQDVAYSLRWAGRRGAVLKSPFRRLFNRLAGTIPLDRDLSALAVGAVALEEGNRLGWFPEGTRTTTGELQDFKPGIGMLLIKFRVPAVPVYIDGAYDAWPPDRKFPRKLGRIEIRIGEPLRPEKFAQDEWDEETAIDKLTEELERRVKQLETP